MTFDPKRHVIKVQGGREYLPVAARLVWFRQEHPDWGIVTQAVEINLEKQYAIFTCTIFNEEGRVMATATKMENVKGFGDYIEKAETGSVGRALVMCGYGTQFAPELDERGRASSAAQSPGRYTTRPNMPPTPTPTPAPRSDYGNAEMPGNGSGYASRPMPAPARPLPEPPIQEPPMEARSAPVPPAPVTRVPERSADRPTPNAPITRVREPERDLADPGGDFEDDEDPFNEDEAAPPPAARPVNPTPRTNGAEAPRRPAPEETNNLAVARSEGNEKEKNSLPRCSVEGCANVLTSSQHAMSQQKFGKSICLMHQRDPAVVGAATGARRNPL